MSNGPVDTDRWAWDEDRVETPAVGAVRRRDVPWLAAAARAGAKLPPGAAPLLASLSDLGLAATPAVAFGEPTVLLSPDVAVRLAPGDDLSPLGLPGLRMRRAMLGVLLACVPEGATHPYPGVASTLAEVRRLVRVRRDSGQDPQLKGGLRELESFRLVELGADPDTDDLLETTSVTLGAAVAAWNTPWVRTDLPLLLRRVRGDEQAVGT